MGRFLSKRLSNAPQRLVAALIKSHACDGSVSGSVKAMTVFCCSSITANEAELELIRHVCNSSCREYKGLVFRQWSLSSALFNHQRYWLPLDSSALLHKLHSLCSQQPSIHSSNEVFHYITLSVPASCVALFSLPSASRLQCLRCRYKVAHSEQEFGF